MGEGFPNIGELCFEKPLQVAQLAQDRAELQMKLAKLEVLVKKVVVKEEVEEREVSYDHPKSSSITFIIPSSL